MPFVNEGKRKKEDILPQKNVSSYNQRDSVMRWMFFRRSNTVLSVYALIIFKDILKPFFILYNY